MMDQEQLDAGNALTREHIAMVKMIMMGVTMEFLRRASVHDDSKLESPEAEMFAEYGPKLRGMTYDPNNPSSEYEECRKKMGEALAHHYEHNSHHPEHFEDGIDGMDLLDLLEMFCDWYAATMRHADGDISKSIVINEKRFNMGPQLVRVFQNTLPFIESLKT